MIKGLSGDKDQILDYMICHIGSKGAQVVFPKTGCALTKLCLAITQFCFYSDCSAITFVTSDAFLKYVISFCTMFVLKNKTVAY